MAAGDVIIQHGGALYIDNAAGSLTDWSSDATDVTVTSDLVRGSYFVLSSPAQLQTQGTLPYAASVQFSFIRKEGASALDGMLKAWRFGTDVARTVEVYSPDTGTGSHKVSGEFVLSSPGPLAAHTAGQGNAGTGQASLASHGAITYSVVA